MPSVCLHQVEFPLLRLYYGPARKGVDHTHPNADGELECRFHGPLYYSPCQFSRSDCVHKNEPQKFRLIYFTLIAVNFSTPSCIYIESSPDFRIIFDSNSQLNYLIFDYYIFEPKWPKHEHKNHFPIWFNDETIHFIYWPLLCAFRMYGR